MKTAEQILKDMLSIKQGLDDFYGKQTVLKALNLALKQGQTLDLVDVSKRCSTARKCVYSPDGNNCGLNKCATNEFNK